VASLDNPPDEGFPVDKQTSICNAFSKVSGSKGLTERNGRDMWVQSSQANEGVYLLQLVMVHQKLLNVAIDKESLLFGTPVTATVAPVLHTLQDGVNELSYAIINLVPMCADGAKADLTKLNSTIVEAIATYS
jgi:hypothetical protein